MVGTGQTWAFAACAPVPLHPTPVIAAVSSGPGDLVDHPASYLDWIGCPSAISSRRPDPSGCRSATAHAGIRTPRQVTRRPPGPAGPGQRELAKQPRISDPQTNESDRTLRSLSGLLPSAGSPTGSRAWGRLGTSATKADAALWARRSADWQSAVSRIGNPQAAHCICSLVDGRLHTHKSSDSTGRWPVGFGGPPRPTSWGRRTIGPLCIRATANSCPPAFWSATALTFLFITHRIHARNVSTRL